METPYFAFEPEVLRKNYQGFEQACRKFFKSFKIVYSVKTNPFGKVLESLVKLNSGFEVASLDEIKSLPKKKFIVFNGVCKTEEELKIAVKNKFLVNVDSKSEIDRLAKILEGKVFSIGLRVSFSDSKFGFEASRIRSIIDYAKSRNLRVICIHAHVGTQAGIREYEENIAGLSRLLASLKLKLDYIDVGGGIPDKFQLKNLSLRLEDYLVVIKKNLGKFDSAIILEPGRAIVADSMILFTKVCAIKENFGKKYAILDAGINILPKITLSSYRFAKEGKEEARKEDYLLAGPLLFSNDILGRFFGNLKEGDILRVENVGAYCYSLAWELSYKRPKIIISKEA